MSEVIEKEVIYLQQSYVNSKGVIIHALFSEPREEGQKIEKKFMAMGQTMVALAGMPGPVPCQFQFQIPGATIEEAFINFAAAFEKASGEAQVQARSDHRKRQLSNIMQ